MRIAAWHLAGASRSAIRCSDSGCAPKNSPPYSRAAATAFHRLPVRGVSGDCGRRPKIPRSPLLDWRATFASRRSKEKFARNSSNNVTQWFPLKITRGRPLGRSSTSSGASKTSSSNSRSINLRGRAHAQTLALVQQHDAVGKFRRQIQFVRHHQHRVAVLIRQPPQAPQQFHFAADIQMLRGLIQQQQRRLLRQRPRQNHALLFAAGKMVHPAIAQRIRAHLRERVSRQQAILLGFESQSPSRRDSGLAARIPTRATEKSSSLSCCTSAMRCARVAANRACSLPRRPLPRARKVASAIPPAISAAWIFRWHSARESPPVRVDAPRSWSGPA